MKLTLFLRDQGGGVLITTGLSILFLVGVAGASIDLGQQQLIRARTQQSSDAAALAAGTISISGVDSAAIASRYFNINFTESYMGVPRPTPSINVGSNISVMASSGRPTSFMHNLGTESTQAGGRTVVTTNPSVKPRKYDLVLVMDNTLSMHAGDVGTPGAPQSRIEGLTIAAKVISANLLNDVTASGSRVGAVSWYTDVDPDQYLPLTTSISSVNSYLDGMHLQCCTDSSEGLEFAQNRVVPDFRDDAVHAIVLLTDGLNNMHDGSRDVGGVRSNEASEKACDAMKKKGVLIYAVGYGKAASNTESEVSKFLARCATQNPAGGSNADLYYFIAPDTSVLDKVFGTILESIKRVRISE